MEEKRYLTDNELRIIRDHKNMIQGNINRMCVSDDIDELIRMYHVANSRIDNIFDICMNRYLDSKDGETIEKRETV